MEIRELSREEVSGIYNKYMTVDFPPEELKPLERILYTMETGLCCAYGIFERETMLGYAVFIIPSKTRYGLLDYLAVIQEHRGMGVGHEFFRQIGNVLASKYPTLLGFFIESESIEAAKNDSERITRERRISFYRHNKCTMTTLGSNLFGVSYSILVYVFDGKSDEMVTLEDLNCVYMAMFKKHHYENNVSLWDDK